MGQHVRCSATGVCYIDSDGDVKSRQIEFTDEGNGGCWKQTPSFFFFFWLEAQQHSSGHHQHKQNHFDHNLFQNAAAHFAIHLQYCKCAATSPSQPNKIRRARIACPQASHSFPPSQERSNRRECKQITLESRQYAFLLPCMLEQPNRDNPKRQVNARIK